MFSSLRKNIKYLEEVSLAKALLFFSIVPITIIMLNADFLKNPYADTILGYSVMITYSLIVGRKNLLLKPTVSLKKNLQIVFYIIAVSGILTCIGVAITGSDNPQGLKDVVYTTEEYLKLNSILPLIGLGEEFLCVLTFMGLFSLLSAGRVRKFILCLLAASLIFGFLHAFHSPFTAVLAIALGHIPYIFATIYFKSILPSVFAHMIWDGLNFFGHFNEELYFMFFSVLMIVYFVYILIPKKKTVTD